MHIHVFARGGSCLCCTVLLRTVVSQGVNILSSDSLLFFPQRSSLSLWKEVSPMFGSLSSWYFGTLRQLVPMSIFQLE